MHVVCTCIGLCVYMVIVCISVRVCECAIVYKIRYS